MRQPVELDMQGRTLAFELIFVMAFLTPEE